MFQIQKHTAGCLKCGKRTAHLLLSLKQREAISRRHHLKFILGHYGSGKVPYHLFLLFGKIFFADFMVKGFQTMSLETTGPFQNGILFLVVSQTFDKSRHL